MTDIRKASRDEHRRKKVCFLSLSALSFSAFIPLSFSLSLFPSSFPLLPLTLLRPLLFPVQQELEEQRKLGNAPAEVDEEGR